MKKTNSHFYFQRLFTPSPKGEVAQNQPPFRVGVKLIFILLFLILNPSSVINSQNLVPNPSFEDTVACPSNLNQVNLATGWMRFFYGTPDYYNRCNPDINSVSVPINTMGEQETPNIQCNAYVGMYVYQPISTVGREFISSELITPLIIGQKYYVSFKASLVDNDKYAIDKLGVLFSTVSYSITSTDYIKNFAHIKSNNIISDTVNWTTISGSFIADSVYKYIIIGNFYDNVLLNVDTIGEIYDISYYYIDDICVSIDSVTCNPFNFNCGTGIIVTNCSNNTIQIYPNPATNVLYIENNIKVKEINKLIIYNSQGMFIEEYNDFKDKYINVQDYSKGIYFISVYSNYQIFTNKFIIN